MPYFRAPIIGTGSPDDPYRPELPPDLKGTWSALIPSDKNGHPTDTTCLVCVDADATDTSKLADSAKNPSVPDLAIPEDIRRRLTAGPARK
jgi:hypothetical protein